MFEHEVSFLTISPQSEFQTQTEVWTQDGEDQDLWHGPAGVIVNTAALEERKAFFRIVTQEY